MAARSRFGTTNLGF